MSPRSMPSGSPIGGNPPCTGPMTATPCDDASRTLDRTIDRMTAITAPGILRRGTLEADDDHQRADGEGDRPAGSRRVRCVIVYHCCSNQLPVPFGMPSMSGI